MTDQSQLILIPIFLVLLPWVGASYPNIGLLLFRSKFAPYFLALTIACAVIGVVGLRIHFWNLTTGLYSFTPLFDFAVFRIAYRIWFSNHTEPPVSVALNWKSGLADHRALAIGIVTVCILVPAFVIDRIVFIVDT